MEQQKQGREKNTDFIGISTSDFNLKPALQTMANQKHNGNLSLMAVEALLKGMEVIRQEGAETPGWAKG